MMLLASIPAVEGARVVNSNNNLSYRVFADAMKSLPKKPAIVFASYNPAASAHRAVVRNFVDLQKADVWIVHDLGERNRALMNLAPQRAVFRFDADRR